MKPSNEIKNVMLHYYESMSRGDAKAIESMLSTQNGTLAIGSDPNEWWEGYNTIDRILKAQLREMSGVQYKAGELETFTEGSVGWAADNPTMQLPDGQEITFRETTIFHREDGDWKMVQHHISLGVPNTETLGKALTVN